MNSKIPIWVMNLIFALFSVFAALGIVEIFFYSVMKTRNLEILPEKLQKSIYFHIRSIIQYEPDLSQYDGELGYIMKKNASKSFNNYEFSTEYQINSMGTRDTNEALSKPDVIFIGDSYTAGWGVNQAEAFPQLFGTLTRRKSLNAGISSYGTAREMLLLRRLLTKETSHIVLQYCFNDLEENRQYVDAGYSLKVMSEKNYLKRSSRMKYYPGRYCEILYFHLRHNIKAAFNKKESLETIDRKPEAQYFLSTLLQHKDMLAGRRLTILISPADKAFLTTLGTEINLNKELQGLKIDLVDTSDLFKPEDMYPIDEHYKMSGHKKIAELLAAKYPAVNAEKSTANRGK